MADKRKTLLPAQTSSIAPDQTKVNLLDLKIDIIKSNTRPVLPVTGLFGGVNQQNELIAHLYVEYPDLPAEGKVKVNVTEQKVIENSLSFRSDHMTREIVATILIPAHLAPAFADWFQNQALMIAGTKAVDFK